MDEMEEREARLEEGREGRGVGRRGDATRLGFRADGEGENTCVKENQKSTSRIIKIKADALINIRD